MKSRFTGTRMTDEPQFRAAIDDVQRGISKATDEDVEIGGPRRLYFVDPAGGQWETAVASDGTMSVKSKTGGSSVTVGPTALTPQQLGAKGDGVTDDAVALQQWLDRGGNLFLPGVATFYRSSQKLILRRTVNLSGACYGSDDNRSVAGPLTPASVIKFDAGVPGMDVQPQVAPTTFPAGVATQEGGQNSSISNIEFRGQGGATAAGFYCRTVIHLFNVYATNFSGRGFDISASVGAEATSEYGDASTSTLTCCNALFNGSDGFRTRGSDANIIKFDTCTAQLNGGWGFNDSTWVGGNLYLNCHAATNTTGSYKAPSGSHKFEHCYVEGGTGSAPDLGNQAVVSGGLLAAYANSANVGTGGYPEVAGGEGSSVFKVLHIRQNYYLGGGAYDLQAPDYGILAGDATWGIVIQGRDKATASVSLANEAGDVAAYVPQGTKDFQVVGKLGAKSLATTALTVATLPSSPTVGQRAFVTDSTVAFAGNGGAAVAGGGGNPVPVYHDGVSWKIG